MIRLKKYYVIPFIVIFLLNYWFFIIDSGVKVNFIVGNFDIFI